MVSSCSSLMVFVGGSGVCLAGLLTPEPVDISIDQICTLAPLCNGAERQRELLIDSILEGNYKPIM